MKIFLVLILCMASIYPLFAQNFVHEFGKYSGEEFQLKNYKNDPAAEAVVIYDIGESYFTSDDYGFQLIFERKTKIKIFTKAGLKWAQISIPYYTEAYKAETILELKGNTYNFENGEVKISELDPKNAYDEKNNDHWFDKKFAMPDVKEGSIIEIYYKVKSPYLFNLRNWEFQCEIPVIYSEYTTKMIPFYKYTYIFQGATKFDNYKSYETNSTSSPYGTFAYKDIAYNFLMKDVPAFKDESFITSPDDYIIKLNFQLAEIHRPDGVKQSIMTTWPEMCKEMIDNSSFGRYMNTCKKKANDIIDTMKISGISATEKAKKIERFVKTNFSWNGRSDVYSTKNVKDLITSKTGNCADINLFLTGILNSAGIEAYPVIISTRNHGKIKLDYPFEHFFNYVIVMAKIDNSTVLLDATEPLSNFNEIPARCINEYGLIIQKDKVEWANLKSNSVSSITYNLQLQLTHGNDSIIQECKLKTTGYEAVDYRSKFLASYKDLKNDLLGNNSGLRDTLRAVDLHQIEKPFEIDFNKKIQVQAIEDKIIISPFCNYQLSNNPLKQPVRNYPVDIIYKKSYNFQTTIVIPKGYELLSKPVDLKINDKLVIIIYNTVIQPNGNINIVGSYEFNKDVYDVSEYTEIKKYFNIIVEKFNEEIVLNKSI